MSPWITYIECLVLVVTCTALPSRPTPFANQTEIFENLQTFINKSNCSTLILLHKKLTFLPPKHSIVNSDQISELKGRIEIRQQQLSCSHSLSRPRRGGCTKTSIDDGFCDYQCNTEENQWDGGDCCPHTCKKGKPLECGSGGYECKGDRKIPVWFAVRSQLCYKWYADGDDGQCGGGAARDLCAGVNSLTPEYRDDTDGRSGGCRMSWGITAPDGQIPDWFRNVEICYRWFADGDDGQCGGGAPAETCAKVNRFTAEYRDDTDGRGGGCQMSWMLSIPKEAEYWAQDISLCYQWHPDGDDGQCGGGADQRICAIAGRWTSYYRDDTDGRGGGCRMQWGLFLE